MKKALKSICLFVVIVCLLVPVFSGCNSQSNTDSSADTAQNTANKDYLWFKGKTVGVDIGSAAIPALEEIGANIAYYQSTENGIEDIKNGKIDGYCNDLSAMKMRVSEQGNENLECINVPASLFSGPIGAIASFSSQPLIDEFNGFLNSVKADGTLADMQSRWLDNIPDLNSPMPDLTYGGEKGVLNVATTGTYVPFDYIGANNELKGYSIELMNRFAAYAGYIIEYQMADFGGLISAVAGGKADIAISNHTITEERKKSVLFTDSIYDDTLAIVTLKPQGSQNAQQPNDYTAYIGTNKTFGSAEGDVYGYINESVFKAAENFEFKSVEDGIIALKNGRIDVYAADYIDLFLPKYYNNEDDIEFIEVPLDVFSSELAPMFATEEMRNRFNVFLTQIKNSGKLDEMYDFWFERDGLPEESEIPKIDLPNSGGTIRATIDSGNASQGYLTSTGEFAGYSVELTERFAQSVGMQVEWIDCDMLTALTYLQSGKSDMFSGMSTKTESRMEQMIYADTVVYDKATFIVRKNAATAALTYEDFIGKKFAVKTGTIYDAMATDTMKSESPAYFSDSPSMLQAVKTGKADAAMDSYYYVKLSLMSDEYSDLDLVTIPEEIYDNPLGAMGMEQSVIDDFNRFYEKIESDGTFAQIKERWLDKLDPENIPKMPEIPLTGENGTLRVAVSQSMPFVFLGDNNTYVGFEIEIMTRFAAYLGKSIEFTDMDFQGVLPYVASGKADLGIAGISITEERKKSVLFTDTYISEPSAVAFRKDFITQTEASVANNDFIAWLKTGIERNLLEENRWIMIVNGLGITILISLLAQVFGTALGCFLCFVLTRRSKFAQLAGKGYAGLIHGLPIVVLLMISYYIIFGKTDISSILIAVCAFSLVKAADVALNLKGAIDTVDKTEIEAARSMGYSAFGAFKAVTLPQALKAALPAYCDGFVELVKSTAIVGYIAIQDLTRAGDIIRSRTYDAFFPLLLVALIYLCVTTIFVQLFKLLLKAFGAGGINKKTK
ncbi:MAG: transporter substrate-binding domain-containing protein [Oscillospiraceae bacterium]|nr:transporter substrate-binding domain-containing protein [Oscillospiraceae bacterium]